MRVLTTNLRDVEQFPATLFGDFYHQRRCIEEGDQRPPASNMLPPDRVVNRAYIHSVLKPLLPSLPLGLAATYLFADALALFARRTFKLKWIHQSRHFPD